MIFRNAIKNWKKVFYWKNRIIVVPGWFQVWDNGVWTCCAKLCTLQREYLLWAVNVLTNSFRRLSEIVLQREIIMGSQRVNKQFFLIRLTQYIPNAWKNRIIVVPGWFQQCLEPVNTLITAWSSDTLITAWSSEARPFRRLSNHLFRSP